MEDDIIIYPDEFKTIIWISNRVTSLIGDVALRIGSMHWDEFNKGIEIFNRVVLSQAESDTNGLFDEKKEHKKGLANEKSKEITTAINWFGWVNEKDPLVLQCLSWLYRSVCYACQHQWSKSDEMLNNISALQIPLIPVLIVKVELIEEIKAEVPTFRSDIEKMERDWNRVLQLMEIDAFVCCTSLEACDAYVKAYPKGKYLYEVETIRKRLAHKTRGWVYITVGVILEIVTVLVCYFVFRN